MKKIAFLALSLIVVAAIARADCSTFTNITEAIPEMTLGEHVNFPLQYVGGTEPYTFEVTSGTLPKGLHLTNGGVLHGVPKELADTTVLITATDAAGCTLNIAFPIRVNP